MEFSDFRWFPHFSASGGGPGGTRNGREIWALWDSWKSKNRKTWSPSDPSKLSPRLSESSIFTFSGSPKSHQKVAKSDSKIDQKSIQNGIRNRAVQTTTNSCRKVRKMTPKRPQNGAPNPKKTMKNHIRGSLGAKGYPHRVPGYPQASKYIMFW